jgi:uncharacterized protein YihD (DUF1040 family)
MRDINRIDKVTNMIKLLWLSYPDLRFFQLIEMIVEKSVHVKQSEDLFYLEDDKLIEVMGKMFESERLGS